MTEKKATLLLIMAVLILLLCACSRSNPSDTQQTSPPEETGPVEDIEEQADMPDEMYDLMSQPTLEPVEMLPVENEDDIPEAAAVPTPKPAIDIGAYRFSALTDTALGFTFNYPTDWENVPGTFTICFRQKREDDSVPSRVAITRKTMVHSVEENTLNTQLSAFVRAISRQYDVSSFQLGAVNREDSFMETNAMSATYLAYSGNTEIKGFVIGCAIQKNIYVFHFTAPYSEYSAMDSIMRYMCNSVRLVTTP